MSDEKKFNNFLDIQIKRINEYSLWEDQFNANLSKKIIRKDQQFNILDKEWIEKWKECVGYEAIKDKCKAICKKENTELKNEIANFLKNRNAQKKVEDLGQLDCSKIKKENQKKNINLVRFEETSNFIPIESYHFNYFNEKEKIYANGDFMKGKCFLNNTFFDKTEEKKIVIFEKNIQNNEINEALLTLEPNENIKKIKH